ncbi:LysR family transcriptional regulator [Pandoraea anhela]|uniref:LysR family transcriptional regulator n=1 Tax=Pandoraea anhela TaxID=2508295 RepID=A0A5E4UEI2_9BURK|nr:LysR family transcriptional regulator [Pandoraea anhela]VVD98445.1 LysR family transcriptional regulator [Pandoraea anhela]
MNKLREIECFIAVVESGSFVKAAESLGISKTAVSRYVADLEARLGTRLLQRTTRRLSLTEPGQRYVERCRQILAELDEADAMAGEQDGEPAGPLRINAPHTFGVLHLAPLWPTFLAQFPHVSLDITLSDRLVDIVDEGYDLAIRISRLPDSSLVHRRLAVTRLVLCASPGYLAQHGTPRHPSELTRHETVGYSYFLHRREWHFDGPDGPVSVQTHARLIADNGDTCVAAAMAGSGIILQPAFLVQDALRDGRLVEFLSEYTQGERGIYVVYPSRKYLSAKVRAMIDFLVEAFAMPGWLAPNRPDRNLPASAAKAP